MGTAMTRSRRQLAGDLADVLDQQVGQGLERRLALGGRGCRRCAAVGLGEVKAPVQHLQKLLDERLSWPLADAP